MKLGKSNISSKSIASNYSIAFWLYVLGILIIVLSNLWLLHRGTLVTADNIYYHVLLNLFAACLLIGGWWMRSNEEKGVERAERAERELETGETTGIKKTNWLDMEKGAEEGEASGNLKRPSRYSPRDDEASAAAEIRAMLRKPRKEPSLGPLNYDPIW